jgi:hypothetical protein
MYGGVKKRGSILVACLIFFLSYLIWFLVRIRKINLEEKITDKMNIVKWYGFSKHLFYVFDKENGFFAKECSDEEKDYLRLKYSELPKYRYFFWKMPAYLFLTAITIMTIGGVIKSGTNLNGKFAWYLFELRHTPIVAETTEEGSTEREPSIVVVQEIVEETSEEDGLTQEESMDNQTDVVEETIPVQYPDEEIYGTINLAEEYYEDENGQVNYHYEVYQYSFSDSMYQKVNETLQNIYDNKILEYQEQYEQNGSLVFVEPILEYQKNYKEETWYLVNLTYAGKDYVSLLYNQVTYWPGAAHPMSYFSPITIDVHTGEIVDVEDVLGQTWSELSQSLYEPNLNSDWYGFYLLGNDVHFIYRTSYFVEEIVIPREDVE